MKLAVIFPGIGYHADKPLLYYSKMLAKNLGYEIREVPYGDFPEGVKGSKEKMEKAFFSAVKQAEQILADVEFAKHEEILFISKSVGTAVASAFALKQGLKTRNIYYTPVEASFQFMKQEGLVFHGTNDSWAETKIVEEGCRQAGFPLVTIPEADHSLETKEVGTDLENLKQIMKKTEEYICRRN